MELVEKGAGDDKLATDAAVALSHELAMVSEMPVLVAIDSVSHSYCRPFTGISIQSLPLVGHVCIRQQ
jgi:hypothetical protein